jgi:O-antigen ligase
MFLVIVALLVPLWVLLRRDFVGGLAYAIVIFIACTHLLRIPTPGVLPELSIHRLVLLILLFFWIQQRDRQQRLLDVPLARYMGVWSLVAFISLLGSLDHVASIKRYFDYVLEFFLLYIIVITSLRNREDAFRILTAACIGLVIVSVLAIVERHSGFNVVDQFIASMDEEAGRVRDVRATYRHRILLGAGMAMGWPLAFYFSQNARSRSSRWLAWLAVLALLAACYYSMSRGPWLAAVLAGGILFVFGSAGIRKPLVLVVCLAALVLVTRPGVFSTVSGYATRTVDADSFKGGTFRYRFDLWRVAHAEVIKSPWRLLFGHGPGSGANQSLDWTLTVSAKDHQIESWDNDFAYVLYQYGFLGLFATLALYAAIPWRLISRARLATGSERDLYVCLGASALVLFFMMTNVMIFARQLYYLLWIATAAGFVLMAESTQTDRLREENWDPDDEGVRAEPQPQAQH